MALSSPRLRWLAREVEQSSAELIASHGDYLVFGNPHATLAARHVLLDSGAREVLRVYMFRNARVTYIGEQDVEDLGLWARHGGMLQFGSTAREGSDFRGYAISVPGHLGFFFGERSGSALESITFWDGGEHIAHMLITRDVLVELSMGWESGLAGITEFYRIFARRRVCMVLEYPDTFPAFREGARISRSLKSIHENLCEGGFEEFFT